MDFAVLQAGRDAEREVYHAVCVESLTDHGVLALRAALSVPVIGADSAALHLACLLGARFTIVGPVAALAGHLQQSSSTSNYGAAGIGAPPHRLCAAQPLPEGTRAADVSGPRVSPCVNPYRAAVKRTCRRAISADHAEVIVLGDTTMQDEHRYVAAQLPVPMVETGRRSGRKPRLCCSTSPRPLQIQLRRLPPTTPANTRPDGRG